MKSGNPIEQFDISNVLDEKSLAQYIRKDEKFIDRLIDITNPDSSPVWLMSFILNYLTGLQVSEEEAKEHYFNIITHKYELSEKLDRDIGFRVASLDYFFNLNKKLKNPRFVEIDLFEKIISLSREDPKFGCFNSLYFKEAFIKELRRSERYQQSLSIAVIDMDNLKVINDNHGHLFADKIIGKFVTTIKKNLREEDILSRFGGDEFCVMLPLTGRVGARSFSERIKMKIDREINSKLPADSQEFVTFSCGLATYPYDGKDYDELFQRADSYLYRAKALGKNRVFDYFDSSEENGYFSSNEDKRGSKRKNVIIDNLIKISTDNDLLDINGRILNISEGGALLECTGEVKGNNLFKKIELDMKKLGDLIFEGVTMDGNIVRLDHSKKFKFQIAMRFNEKIDDKNLQEIMNKLNIV